MADPKMLNFKMGEWTEGFDKIDKVPGTVYITTNEKAMYVDVDDNTRIRIGDIIQVPSARVAKPPFSTEALYYFIEENALLKWGPYGDGGAMAWKQLNSISELETNISSLKTSVTTLTNIINGNPNGDNDLEKAGLAKRLTAAEADIDDLESGLNTINGVIGTENDDPNAEGSLYARIKKNTNDIGTVSAKANENERKIQGLTSNLSTLGEKLGTSTDTSNTKTAFQRIESLETAVGDGTGLSGRLENLEDTVGDTSKGLVKDVNDIKTAIGSNATGAETGIYKELKNIKDKNNQQDDNISTIGTTINGDPNGITQAAKDGIIGRLTKVEEKAKSNTEIIGTKDSSITEDTIWDAIKANKEAAASNATAIGDANSGLIKDVNKNKEDIGTLTNNITTLNKSINGDPDAIEGTDARLGLVGRLNNAEDDIDDLQSANESLVKRVKATEDHIGQANQDSGGSGSLYERIASNRGEINDLKTAVGSNTSNISKLGGKLAGIGDNETVVSKIETEITNAKSELTGQITEQINAANAMDYIGGVELASDLPTTTTGVKIGDTYVATKSFPISAALIEGAEPSEPDKTCYAGDLLVATGNEDKTSGTITSGLKWTYVNTGYIKNHEATLDAADNHIRLSSHLANLSSEKGDLGIIEIKADREKSNLTINTTTDANNGNKHVITIGMEWGSF